MDHSVYDSLKVQDGRKLCPYINETPSTVCITTLPEEHHKLFKRLYDKLCVCFYLIDDFQTLSGSESPIEHKTVVVCCWTSTYSPLKTSRILNIFQYCVSITMARGTATAGTAIPVPPFRVFFVLFCVCTVHACCVYAI